MPSGDGTFYLYLNGEIRSITGTEVGDEVRIELVRDARYRGGPIQRVPQGLVAGLRSRASAARRWNGLSPSLKKEVVRYLARLKSPEARERNIVRALRVLSGSSERFLGRQWNERPEVKPAGRPRGGGPDPVSAPRPGGRARARPRPPD